MACSYYHLPLTANKNKGQTKIPNHFTVRVKVISLISDGLESMATFLRTCSKQVLIRKHTDDGAAAAGNGFKTSAEVSNISINMRIEKRRDDFKIKGE